MRWRPETEELGDVPWQELWCNHCITVSQSVLPISEGMGSLVHGPRVKTPETCLKTRNWIKRGIWTPKLRTPTRSVLLIFGELACGGRLLLLLSIAAPPSLHTKQVDETGYRRLA